MNKPSSAFLRLEPSNTGNTNPARAVLLAVTLEGHSYPPNCGILSGHKLAYSDTNRDFALLRHVLPRRFSAGTPVLSGTSAGPGLYLREIDAPSMGAGSVLFADDRGGEQ